MITVKRIFEAAEYLDAVKELGDKYTSTLGLLPYDAYDGYARKNTILIALTDSGVCAGYLLYNLTKKVIA